MTHIDSLRPRPSARTTRQLRLKHLTRRQVYDIRQRVLAAGAAQNLAEARSQSKIAYELAEKYGVDFNTIIRATYQRVFH